ncbi:pullulanase-type alpha-1,6-glucosidase [Mangrovactinospora gilvigrisea]|uniref:pullulanase-type alpha-1,6-glucosidase n=1 Tax=Mangrovactinospora gilvigrisea TaxID=1428644 RepID=UPI003012EF16
MQTPARHLGRRRFLAATAATGAALVAARTASASDPAPVDPAHARALWIDAGTVAWQVSPGAGGTRLRSLTGGPVLRLALDAAGLTDAQLRRFPYLKGCAAFTVDPRDRALAPDALRGGLLAEALDASGAAVAATGVQTAGVLDDLYAEAAAATPLGPVFDAAGRPALAVWAPTAADVRLELDGSDRPMRRDDATGIWSIAGPAGWRGKPYRYAVTVWAPSTRAMVTNRVTDPYSLGLTADSARSLLIDLDDPALQPPGWHGLRKPAAVPLRSAQIQELHIRDHSAEDATVPAELRGGYAAFAAQGSAGTRHLAALAAAGATHVHLQPAFDFASVPELPAEQQQPAGDLASYPPDSDRQQAAIAAVADRDAFNWGYDPWHYTVPEGSYSSDPDGPVRTREFRAMVAGLNRAGLRAVMDVVYNHTDASGQDAKSVLDRIVPGYYHRLLADGSIAGDATGAPTDTAPENAMMGRLVVDSVVTWARAYKVDGFRFDLMGFHPKANLLAVRAALDALTPEKDGIDGKAVVVYGEGWNFGAAGNDARFVQATQAHMAGTGIATFSDRARDAVRGGSPFDADPGIQGFGSGLFTDPNSSTSNGSADEQRARLLHYQDLIKVGLTGNLAGYAFTDSSGRRTTGAGVDYNGSPAGYAAAPGDALAYVDCHDNEALYDALAYKLPQAASPADRARMQVVALATAVLSQGPALQLAGSDLLRSKSLDKNSYNSGDWFNAVHWTASPAANGFGRGLPQAADNQSRWPYARPLLADPRLKPTWQVMAAASAAYRDLLRIRTAEPAFHLATAEQVQQQLEFPLSGTAAELPGAITFRLADLVVVLNAGPAAVRQVLPGAAGARFRLHPGQAEGADPVVKAAAFTPSVGAFSVPARTAAVFTRR